MSGAHGGHMTRCETCGNDYDNTFTVTVAGRSYTFDCFECAVHKLAPTCGGCGCRILGHGVQSGADVFCSAHCARRQGVLGLSTRVEHMVDRV